MAKEAAAKETEIQASATKAKRTIGELAEAIRQGEATPSEVLRAYAEEGKVVLVSLKAPELTVVLEPETETNTVASGKIHTQRTPGTKLEFRKNKAAVPKELFESWCADPDAYRRLKIDVDFMEEGKFREYIRKPQNRANAIKLKETMTWRRQLCDGRPKNASEDWESIIEEFRPGLIGNITGGR